MSITDNKNEIGLFFSVPVIFIISIVLFLIAVHSLMLCIIEFDEFRDILSLFLLLFGFYVCHMRFQSCTDFL